MRIDITEHLRRLVLAGLPLVGVACQEGGSARIAQPQIQTSARCSPREIVSGYTGNKAINIGFDAADPRWADLYEACLDEGSHCTLLCRTIIDAADIPRPSGHVVMGPGRCELACDADGNAVASVEYSTGTPPVPGRRPDGYAQHLPTAPGTSLAAFFTASAALEGASITSFRTLAAELCAHGAPSPLVSRARAAARDEARHFRAMARLAQAFGASRVRCPRPARPPIRPLETIAHENATEGCVNETFSAALALWQSRTAGEAAVRQTFAAISEDECRHAQLAWDVDAWIGPQLAPDARARVEAARAKAARALVAGAAMPTDARLQRDAGLPAPRMAHALAQAARTTLWG